MTNLRDRPLHGVAVYNPDLLSKQELCEQFVARRPLLQRLLDDFGREGAGQHHLLIGQRGMGKTMLLRRLRYAIEDDPRLSQRWLPLTFPEEQYNVARLSDFYMNCIDALGDALDRLGRRADAKALDDAALALPDKNERERSKRALELLLGGADRLKKRLLLLIDNIDIILDRLKDEQWTIREVLSAERRRLSLVGASSAMIESTYEYNKPFYEFFQIHELRGLNESELREVLRNLARLGNQPAVERVLDDDPVRIRTLHALAGGNPRTVVLLYDVLARGAGGDVRSDLERLLDQCTPLYKARFEALPAQSQQVVDALAIHWDPISAGELAEKVRLDKNVVSSQLNRLVQQGLVEKVSYHPSTKTGFQIAERFFDIWYLMRASRRVRQRLIWLVEFLKLLYGGEQLRKQAERHLHTKRGEDADSRLRHAELSLALAQVVDEVPLRNALESTAMRSLMVDRDLREKIADLVDLKGADASLRSLAGRHKAAAEIQEAIASAKVRWKGWEPVRFGKLLGGSPVLSLTQKLEIATKIGKLPRKRVDSLMEELESVRAQLQKNLGSAAEPICEAFQQGYIDDVQNPHDIEIAAEAFGSPALWSFLGDLLHESGNYAESEVAYRKAIGIDPGDSHSWFQLGLGLRELKRYGEAEGALRRAVDLGSLDIKVDAWYCLGSLLKINLGRYEEAAGAFHNVLEIEPRDAIAWIHLAHILAEYLGQLGEAEDACRRAVEIEPSQYFAWDMLAQIRYAKGEVDQETEAAARRAVALAPDNHLALFTLATILVHLGRWSEAEPLAKRFISDSSAEVHEEIWHDVVTFFREAVRTGHAKDAMKLLDDLDLAERWRPLREALSVIAAGTKDPLRRVAPEVRNPAEMILSELLPGGLN